MNIRGLDVVCVLMIGLKQLAAAVLGAWTAMGATAAFAAESPADVVFFEEKIRPVLAAKCYKCHSDRAQKLKGELKLDSHAAILKGGATGPAVVPKDPAKSLLLTALRHVDKDTKMPPDEKLADTVILDFEKWIKAGAVFPAAATVAKADIKMWWELVDEKKLLPATQSIASVVDHYVGASLKTAGITPVPSVDDHGFIRRVTLDLCGRIPTGAEVKAFVESKAADKRVQLVDQLMASPSFLRHQVIEFEWLLADGKDKGMRPYLEQALGEGRPWDRMFKEIIVVDPDNNATKGATAFLKERAKDLDQLTVDVSVKFFGVNVSCAQCHDHPEVPSWKQDHYFGMKSFFSRTFEAGGFVAERDYGLVSFKTTKGETKQAALMFLNGKPLAEPEVKEPDKKALDEEKKRIEQFTKDKRALPPPSFSRRQQIVTESLRPGEEGFFARALVNRLWHRLHGHGLVMPLDQMHGANKPSHPELMQWLARDLVAHKYNWRPMLRGLVLSQTYARGSRWGDSQRPAPGTFAVALPKPLTPHQLGASLYIAAQDPETFAKPTAAEQAKVIEQYERGGHGWASQFERPGELFQIGVDEALYFSNADRVQKELLTENGGRILKRVLDTRDTREQIQVAFLNCLSRPPTVEEANQVDDYLTKRKERQSEAWRQVIWSILASGEFRFNH